MKNMVRLLLATAALTSAVPAQAVSFNLIDTGGTGIGTKAREGFETAAFFWSSMLTDDVTINLNIGFSALGPNTLAQANTRSTLNFNSQVYDALAADITSSVDSAAVASLRPLEAALYGTTALTATTNALNATRTGYLDNRTRVDNDKSINNQITAVNSTVSKALGITTDANGQTLDYGAADGGITFSDGFNFDFDPRDGIAAAAIDFIGVAIHEIGHILGFVSGVDTYDLLTMPGSTIQNRNAGEDFGITTVLDYYRYGAPGQLDWSTQGNPYLSIDGGVSQMFGNSLMSTGTYNGDGRQASHLKDAIRAAPQLGVMDPTSGYGQMQQVTALDLASFDMIGWNLSLDALTQPTYRVGTDAIYANYLSVQSAVPEPATWAMMSIGMGLAAGALRRRRSAKVKVSFA